MPSRRRKRPSVRTNIFQFLSLIVALGVVGGLFGVMGAGLALPAVGVAGAVAKAVPETFHELPAGLEVTKPSEGSRMLDADGRVLAQFFSERRTVVTSEQIAPIMKEAIVAIEDWRFYSHHGIDPEGMVRALANNLAGGGREGASTITQQYVKNILIEQGVQAGDQDMVDEAQELSMERKLREARYAVALEARMTKEEILTGYLNLATFGANIFGVEAASRAYFSKSASELTVDEAALLAGAVQSPSEYDPLVHPEAAQKRRDVVLGEMRKRGYITQDEYRDAVAVPVEDMLHPETAISGCSTAGNAAYFCQYAVAQFLADDAFGADRAERERLLYSGGLTIRTTLSASKQDAAYNAVVSHVPVDDPSGVNAVLVSVVPDTGDVVAMAQNTPFGVATEDNPRATLVNYSVGEDEGGGGGFQPGSTFKTFTLVQWFSEGHSAYEPVGRYDRVFPSGSFKCGGTPLATEAWKAGDLPGKDGVMTPVRAMQSSVNQAIADMATKVDFCQILEKAAAMGAVSAATGEAVETYPPNLIGAAEVTPLAMASAYGTIANDGVHCKAHGLSEVEGPGGVIKTFTPDCSRAIDATVAKQTATVLTKVAQAQGGDIGRPWAAKSGTTDYNDNVWTVGFTPELATAGWAGFAAASGTPMQNITVNGHFYTAVFGGEFGIPLWLEYMKNALEGEPVQPIPDVFIGNQPVPTPAPTPTPNPAPGTGSTTGGTTGGTAGGTTGGTTGGGTTGGTGGRGAATETDGR